MSNSKTILGFAAGATAAAFAGAMLAPSIRKVTRKQTPVKFARQNNRSASTGWLDVIDNPEPNFIGLFNNASSKVEESIAR